MSALETWLGDAPAARPPRPTRGDLGLAAFAIGLALLEGFLRDDVTFRAIAIVAAVTIAGALAFRRAQPLLAVLVAFGVANVLTLIGVATHQREIGLHASILVLLTVYSLVRGAPARHVVIGLGAVAGTYVLSLAVGEIASTADAIGALAVLSLPAALGATVRSRDRAHQTDLERAKLRERQMLARELHDTIGHHVAAIAIQAQAARAARAKRPELADRALDTIESEARRALDELRGLVGALRDESAAPVAPTGGAAAIDELVRSAGERATFVREGDLERLPPAIDLALHRIASEALHNALAHAEGATRIELRLVGEPRSVRLTVRDDGRGSSGRADARRGFGLVGMEERATLLGGSFHAGPMASGGFEVAVTLPRGGSPA